MLRSSREVAVRTLIYGTLGARASMELTQHPRLRALCSDLLPWLQRTVGDGEIAEFHREILATPHGELPRESQVESYWRGEAASLLGWVIQLCDRPAPETAVSPDALFSSLQILQPNAGELLSTGWLRPQLEIEDLCVLCIAVRQERQTLRLQGDAQATLRRIHQDRLHELGLSDAFHRLQQGEVESLAASTSPGTAGLSIARAQVAEWLFGVDD